jgi:serine phosphatase RsbU (regulator of sigma subunit)
MSGGENSTSGEPIESHAFYRATLNSEWYRIVGLLGLLAALVLYTVARGIMVGGFRLLWVQTVFLALAIAHELHVLRAVRRALQHEKDVPPAIWAVNVIVESQLPTLSLFLLLASEWMNPYQVLVAPAVMVYFLFIILSTLRLSPSLTMFTGLMSALGYLFVTFYVEAKFQSSRVELGAFPQSLYVIYSSVILLGGVVGAIVAGQIRGYVAAALREAELQGKLDQVKHDLDIARSIQQELLPASAPKLEDFEIAGWNQPADQTGGDYFDWQSLPDGRIAISLGDATGHGIGPALVSTSCRAYARASLLASGGKNGLLGRLNKLLAEDLSANRFVTFAVAFLDAANANVKILSAGHGPILWYKHASDQIENLEAQGIPLGMIAAVEYSEANEAQLAPGDMLALVTDGFYEWANPEGEEFGMKRLEAVIRESRDDASEAVIERLRASVMNFCRGTKQQDDLTAVIIRRKATPFVVKKGADREAA